MKKIGIYGGTFAPPHNGHIHAAAAFLRELELDKLYIVPAFIPPHKSLDFEDSPEARLEMTRLAFSGLERTEISDFEMTRGGKSFTVNTLEHFSAEGELTFLCGTDMFLSLEKWYRFERIFELSGIALMRREEKNPETDSDIEIAAMRYAESYGARLVMLRSLALDMSSTFVRRARACGEPVRRFVPTEVSDYIAEKELYRSR